MRKAVYLYFASFVRDLFVLFAQFVFVTDAFVRRVFGRAGPSNGPTTTRSRCPIVPYSAIYVTLILSVGQQALYYRGPIYLYSRMLFGPAYIASVRICPNTGGINTGQSLSLVIAA